MSALTIDLRDRRPIYEQLIDQIVTLVLQGVMQAGEQLPSVRSLAVELAINPNTIQKAYTELERRGVTYSVAGRGSFVNADLEAVRREHIERISAEIRALLEEARAIGLAAAEAATLITSVWKEDEKK